MHTSQVVVYGRASHTLHASTYEDLAKKINSRVKTGTLEFAMSVIFISLCLVVLLAQVGDYSWMAMALYVLSAFALKESVGHLGFVVVDLLAWRKELKRVTGLIAPTDP